jgi:hypothetical protein
MMGTPRIERRTAMGTVIIRCQVFVNGEFRTACAAQDRLFIKFVMRPWNGRMICHLLMTLITGIVGPAAFEFNRNDIPL